MISCRFHPFITKSTACSLCVVAAHQTFATAVVTTAAAPDFLGIQATVDNFRTSIALGGHQNGAGGFFPNGFRNINWDAVPSTFADPNPLPGTFFNSNSPRGLLMTTPGPGFLLSAAEVNPTNSPVRFGTIDPSYTNEFSLFSEERLFIARGSTITDNQFFVPGSPNTAASIFAFGVVFTDVDILGTTTLEFFDLNHQSLGVFSAPVQDGGLSFLGVAFDAGERVGSVRVMSGNAVLNPGVIDGAGVDVVAVDDFIYSEPAAIVPEPSAVSLTLLGIGIAASHRQRRRADTKSSNSGKSVL